MLNCEASWNFVLPWKSLSHKQWKWSIIQENTRNAVGLQLEISLLGFEILGHPPYSLDLASMDFCVFPELKSQLREKNIFDSADDHVKHMQAFTDSWYVETYNKWINQHRKCAEIEKVRRSMDLNIV